VWRDHLGSGSGAGGGSAASVSYNPLTLPAAAAGVAAPSVSPMSASALDSQLAYIRRLGLTPTVVQVGNSYHIGVGISASDLASSLSEVPAPASTGAAAELVGVGTEIRATLDWAIPTFGAENLSRSATGSVIPAARTAAISSNANLLLLDQVLEHFGAPRSESSDEYKLASSDNDYSSQEQLGDLALAAVFDNETDWRNTI
jgi:hypothetical protein